MDQPGAATTARPFVGREREFAELLAAGDDAAAGRGGFVLVAGDLGVGKTRLCAEFSAAAERRGATVAWGRCPEHGSAAAWRPWLQILRVLLRTGTVAADDPRLPEIARGMPPLQTQVPAPAAAELVDPDQARFRLHDAVAMLLDDAAARRPLVLVFDDLHDADHGSLRLLHFVARELHRAPLLLVGTYRDDAARAAAGGDLLHGDLARESRRIHLRGLGVEPVRAFIADLTGRQVAPAIAAAVHAATGGNPFFLDEVVRLAHAEGRLAGDDPEALAGLPVPDPVRATLQRRLGPLPPAARAVLDLAAIVGRTFDPALLAAVAGTEATEAALAAARRLGLVEDAADGGLAFANVLLRDALYEGIPAAERAAGHERVGAALATLPGSDPDLPFQLAHHFALACAPLDASPERLARAREHGCRAATAAAARVAHHDAVRFLGQALACAERDPQVPAATRAALLIDIGNAAWSAADVGASAAAFGRALDLTRDLVRAGDPAAPALLADAALGLGGRQQRAHVAFEADVVAAVEEALAAIGGADPRRRARLLARLAYALYSVPGSFDRRETLCAEATTLARAAGDAATLVSVLNDSRWALWSPATTEARLRTTDELIDLATQTRDHERLIGEHAWRLVDLFELGDRNRAWAELQTYTALAGELRLPWYDWYVGRFQTLFAIVEGRFDEAEALAGRALEAARRVEHGDALLVYGVALMSLRALQGRLDEIESGLQAFAAEYPRLAAWRFALAWIQAQQGRHDHAAAELDRLAADDFADLPGDYMRLAAIAWLAEVCHTIGDALRAAPLYDMLAPWAERCIVVGYGISGLGSAERPLGLLASTLGRHAEAVRHFERALATNERLGARPFAALTRFDLACELRRSADPAAQARAAGLIAQARDQATRLGMAELLRRIDALTPCTVPEPATPLPAVPPADAILRREGEFWSVSRGGRTFRLKHVRGLDHLATLLAHPGRPFHVADLSGVTLPGGDAGAVLDPAAKAAYRRRLEALRERAAEAEAGNDRETAARARVEIDALAEQLAQAVGLGGRDRRASADAERVRIAVTKAIRVAERRIAAHDAELARYLELTVQTGMFCEFTPAPGGMAIEVENPG